MTLEDPLYKLTERERKMLKNSWAEHFSNTIFPMINEERFSVLYSNNPASRPNNPVNVYVGLLMIREIFSQSDEEALQSLMFDIRYQYALHTTSFEEQPISKNSLTNIRTAVYKYYEQTGVDLIQEEVESHAKEFSKLLNIEGRTNRMDSLMVSSSCKKLARLEIIYSCVSRLIKVLSETDDTMLPEKFKIYLEEGHRNDTIYRCADKDVNSKIKVLISAALELHQLCADTPMGELEDFKILSRMLGEQTHPVDGNVELKPAREIGSESLQNPTDPDATFCKKGKRHVGYVANVVENFDDQNRIITHYDLQQNTYSDQTFTKDIINKLGQQDETTKILVDGAFFSAENSKQANENNIELMPTNLVGSNPKSEKSGYELFEIDEETHVVNKCPMNYKPSDSSYKKQVYRAHFPKEFCDNCPHRPNCPVVKQKKQYLLEVCETKLYNEKMRSKMNTEEYEQIAKKRAGIEGIPSVLRRKYNIDYLPVRGKVRSKVWLGFKIEAINFKRYMKSRIESAKSLSFSLLYNHLLEVFSFQRSIAANKAA